MQPAGSSDNRDKMDQIRVEAYVKIDGKTAGSNKEPPGRPVIPAMVSIAAPAGGTAGRSEAVDLVLCLHHSGSSVPRKRARLLNEAVRVVVDLLGTNDRLAILPIQGALQPISDQVWVKARNELPEMAITSNLPLVTALGSAESVLFERSREERERSGHIIIISNSREEMGSQESLLPWRFQSLHALGFRSADNARAMYSIAANSRECTYGVLDDEDGRITKVLDATMKRITSMAGATMPIEVKLKCEQNAILSSIDSPLVSYFISSDKKAGIIWASGLLSCSGTKFVVHLSSMGDGNFPPDNPEEWSNLLKVEVKHDQVSGKAHIKGQLQGEVVAVKKDMDGDSRSKKPKKVASKEVAAEMVRYMAVTLVTDIVATEKRDWEQLHAAAQHLCDRWATHKESSCGIEATEGGLISNLDENIKEMEIRMYNNYLWREYMLSWLSHQRWQIPLPPLFMDKQAVDELPIQLEIFAKAGTPDNQQQAHQGGLPMLLRVKVPETGLAKLKTPFVDVVMVLDKGRPRREMENQARERLQLLSKAVDFVMSKLRHKDRLAILPVNSSATTTPPKASCFLEMSNQGQRDTDNYMLDMTEQMTKVSTPQNPIQTSIWRKQLNKTMKTLGNCLHISGTNTTTTTPSSSPKEQHTVSTTNSAAADGSSINQLTKAIMDARKMLDDRPKHETERVGFIIVISDSDYDSFRQQALISIPNCTIHAFGFSGTHNARAMYDIANSSNGIYGVLNERNLITEAFKSCIDRITSIVVVDTKVDFTCTNDSASSAALLSTVETGQFKFSVADNHKSCSVWLGAIHATSVKNFIFYLDNMGGHGNMSKQFTAQVSCSPAAKSTEDVRENGEKICSSRSGIDRYDEEVEAGIARVAAVKMVTKITDPNFDQQLETCLPGEMETMQKIFASATEKLDANLEKKTADMNYNMKLMQRLPWEMCLRIYEYTREAGKARHEREKNKNKSRRSMMNYQHAKVSQNHVHNAVMEAVLVSELERLEANLDGQITEPSYYQLLVERLMKELSPQGSGYSAQDAQTDGKVKLMKEKMSMEMENMEACFSIQITDPTNNKELVANLVERMCKSCAKHAQSTGETQLAMELEKMHHRLGKEIVAMICKEVTVPMYYKKFMALIARLKCLNVSERERVVGNARYALRMEKMEATLAREMEKMDTIYLMDYHQIMVVLLVREMFLSVCEHAQIAGGETRLIEDMENMENLLHNEMDNADYYKTLVKSNLSYLLSWLSFRRSCELKSHTP